ncbi:oligosaccharide flippase family protein [uncultured Phocaeicola sp.]|jgi:O-antigen/teichoic acid export membrane protein|uniref:oligosaccharide flippase family protein n=1 Tax=uncultured Phocaeicola sp. TaxID=990718 RepID=UPI00259105DF|nr:oligosaccharide flippase family protein [uncultured Phocaeicola sp.]
MKVNQIKLGSVLSYISIGLNVLVALLYTPFLLRMLGQNEYGLYSLVASVVAYLTVLDLGFGNAIVRYISKYRAENKLEEQSELLGMSMIIYCAISIVVIAFGVCFISNISLFFNSTLTHDDIEKVKVMMSLLVFNLAFTFPMSIWGAVLTAYEEFVFPKLINIVRIILNPLVMIILLCYGYKAITMVIVLTTFNILTLCINAWYCRKKVYIRFKLGKFRWDMLREVLIYSFWIFLNSIMDKIYYSSGQFVLGMFSGVSAVAVYAIAIQLQHLYITLSSAISGMFLPKITAMYAKGMSDKSVSDLFIKVGRVQWFIILLILCGFILFGQKFILLWAGSDYVDAYWMTLLLFIPSAIPLIQSLGIVILQARNKMRFRSLSFLFISIVCMIASIPLAKLYGGIGFAFGTSMSIILAQGIVINIYYKRKIHLDIYRFFIQIARMSIAPVLLTMVWWFGLHYVQFIDSIFNLILWTVLFGMTYIIVSYYSSMNNYERELILSVTKNIKTIIK